jgi:hypothetical protein
LIVDLDLNNLAMRVFGRFLNFNATMFHYIPFYTVYTLEGKQYVSPQLRSGKLHSSSLRVEYLHNLFEILLCRSFISCFLFSLNDLFNYLLISIWIHGHLFYMLGYNPTLFSLLCYLDCSNFGHWEVFGWCPMPLWHFKPAVLFLFALFLDYGGGYMTVHICQVHRTVH